VCLLGLRKYEHRQGFLKLRTRCLAPDFECLEEVGVWHESNRLVLQAEDHRTRGQDKIQSVIFQDPAFNEVDIEYLHGLGFKVVSTPSAFDYIDSKTFLFAPHLESNIYAMALERGSPALSVGSEVATLLDR